MDTTIETTTAAETHILKTIAGHAPAAARIVLGLAFLVFGLNYFLNFIPPPKQLPPEGAMSFAMALMKTGYMFPLVKGTEVLVGALLLSNRLVPLALALLAPVMVNIVAFHAFLAPAGMTLVLVLVALHGYLAWTYRRAYAPMLAVRVATSR